MTSWRTCASTSAMNSSASALPLAISVRRFSHSAVRAGGVRLSGKEVFAAATINYKEEVLFTINYRTDITTAHVVRYKGVLYDITRVDAFEGYKEDLTLYCSRRVRQ